MFHRKWQEILWSLGNMIDSWESDWIGFSFCNFDFGFYYSSFLNRMKCFRLISSILLISKFFFYARAFIVQFSISVIMFVPHSIDSSEPHFMFLTYTLSNLCTCWMPFIHFATAKLIDIFWMVIKKSIKRKSLTYVRIAFVSIPTIQVKLKSLKPKIIRSIKVSPLI